MRWLRLWASGADKRKRSHANRSAQQAIAAAQAESRQLPQQLANYHGKKKAPQSESKLVSCTPDKAAIASARRWAERGDRPPTESWESIVTASGPDIEDKRRREVRRPVSKCCCAPTAPARHDHDDAATVSATSKVPVHM